jgi:hypothetical protein
VPGSYAIDILAGIAIIALTAIVVVIICLPRRK